MIPPSQRSIWFLLLPQLWYSLLAFSFSPLAVIERAAVVDFELDPSLEA